MFGPDIKNLFYWLYFYRIEDVFFSMLFIIWTEKFTILRSSLKLFNSFFEFVRKENKNVESNKIVKWGIVKENHFFHITYFWNGRLYKFDIETFKIKMDVGLILKTEQFTLLNFYNFRTKKTSDKSPSCTA